MICPDFDKYKNLITSFDQAVSIDKDKDKPLRFNVWKMDSDTLKTLFKDYDVDNLPQDDIDMSQPIKRRIASALNKLQSNTHTPKDFTASVINSDNNIELSIAMYEVMESVKGESDKANNLDVNVDSITSDGILPALPLARVAAVIGRKIAYQKGYRFKARTDDAGTKLDMAKDIETLYYQLGMRAVEDLQEAGYVTIQNDVDTIKDYIKEEEIGNKFAKVNVLTKGVKSVSLSTSKLGIKPNTEESAHFLNRTDSNLSETALGAVVDSLRAVRMVTQPSTVVLPDTKYKVDYDYSNVDATGVDPMTAEARESLYKNPLHVNASVTGLVSLLNKEVLKTGKSAVDIIVNDIFKGDRPGLIKSLFGIQEVTASSVDKKESAIGQNLSKSVPIEDLAEYYDIIDGKPLHMPMFDGRNKRLYYQNSVLNAHASKQSRYMLTAGEYEVDFDSDDFKYLVNSMADTLGDSELTYDNFVSDTGSKLDKALDLYNDYENETDLEGKLGAISYMARLFPGRDYVTLLTVLKGVKDIRNTSKGKIKTEFMVASDATASGGTLTLTQAVGTNANIVQLLEKIGIVLNEDGKSIAENGFDLYQVMSSAIDNFIANPKSKIAPDLGKEGKDLGQLMNSTVDVLFGNIRDLSKSPTMTFIYGQGKKGSINSMNNDIADRVMDNLDNIEVREYLSNLLGSNKYKGTEDLKSVKGLYKEVHSALNSSGITPKLYDLLESDLKKKYLQEYNLRSDDIFKIVQKLGSDVDFKILPASAVMSGIKPTKDNLRQYGMPISKVFEVQHDIGSGDSVLTRKSEIRQSVMNVSPIHGVDSALLYRSIAEVSKKMDTKGIVVVHDEVRGAVHVVRAVEEEYAKQYLQSSTQYDIHSEVLNAVKAYDPTIAETAKFKSLEQDIKVSMDAKKKLFSSRFNKSTSALIGDGGAHTTFADNAKFDSTSAQIREEIKKDAKQEPENDAINRMKDLSSESDLISKFLESVNRSSIKTGKENVYIPDSDTVVISGTDQGVGTGQTLDMSKDADRKVQKQLIEHEIVHAMSVNYIQKGLLNTSSVEGRDVAYMLKAVNKLRNVTNNTTPERLSKLHMDTFDRISYISGKPDHEAVAELVSILIAEPDAATDIYNLLNDKTSLKKIIVNFVKRIKQRLLSISAADLDKELDIEKLYGAVSRSIDNGLSERQENYQEAVKNQKAFQQRLGAGNVADIAPDRKATLRYLNYAMSSMVNSKLERNGKRILGNIHARMYTRFPLYSDASDKLKGVYDNSDALQQILHTITGEGVDKNKKADLLSKMSELSTQQMATLNTQKEQFQKELKKLSSKERKTIGEYVTKSPLHDYFILADGLDTSSKMDSEISKLEAKYANNKQALNDVDNLVRWNIGVKGKDGTREQVSLGNLYNLETRYPMSKNSELGTDLRKLLALKSIKELGYTEFENLLEKTELVNLIKDSVVANRLSLVGHDGISNLRDSLIADKWKEPLVMKAVTKDQLKQYTIGESTGWEVLRTPKGDNELGVVYKKIIDSTHLAGAYTDIKLSSTDIDVSNDKSSYDGVVASSKGYKLRLTDAEKESLGIVSDFSDMLAHTTAHSMAVQDSQAIRDELLKMDTRHMLNNKASETALVDKIEAKNLDNPWFVKLGAKVNYHELSPVIRAKYKQVKGASNVHGFDKEVSLVRKDISHWLLGDSAKSLFTGTNMQWATRVVKDLVAGAKLSMVVLNPVKIANDNLSNLAYLGTMGADPIFIAKQYKDISKAMGEYSELQESITQLRLKAVANPGDKAIQKRMVDLQEAAKNTSIGDIANKGFMNSLGSDIIQQSADTSSGLQADMHTALNYLMHDKKGNKNVVAHFITRASNIGWNSEDFLKYLGGIVKRSETAKGAEAELDKVYDRLKTIRNDEDITNYVAQYTTSPSSELVKAGGKVTDLTDILAKETLYRHLTQNENMSPKDARIRVLDSFPDYKENMPLAIKQMSDAGIIMFPSFWLRIQKVIYRMARDKPVNFGTELMLQDMLGSDVNTIVGSNIMNKANSFGGIFHTPFEHTGVGSVVPTHLF